MRDPELAVDRARRSCIEHVRVHVRLVAGSGEEPGLDAPLAPHPLDPPAAVRQPHVAQAASEETALARALENDAERAEALVDDVGVDALAVVRTDELVAPAVQCRQPECAEGGLPRAQKLGIGVTDPEVDPASLTSGGGDRRVGVGHQLGDDLGEVDPGLGEVLCLADEERAVREARFDDSVGRRIQDWSSNVLGDEVTAALEEFVGPERVLDDADIQIFADWFHNARELAGGGTPAERYAARPELPASERDAAARIAEARLGLYRVLAVVPGRSLHLEELVVGRRFDVRSPHVSREAVRWDILLARVIDGDPPSFWGPVRFFEPCEEPELRAELVRLAGSPVDELDEQALASISRQHALELMRFMPPSRNAEPSFFTLEGDPVVFASAIWDVHDRAAAAKRMRDLGGLLPDDPVEIDITAARATLVRNRPPLPPGALILESSLVGAMDTIPIATLRLEGNELHAEAMSEQRLEQTLGIVSADFGELVQLRSKDITSVEEALAARGSSRKDSTPPPADVRERRLVGELATERMRRWLDEPHQLLGGRTPREAAADADRAEVVRLLQQIENGAERARLRGEPSADVTPLRNELGLNNELAA